VLGKEEIQDVEVEVGLNKEERDATEYIPTLSWDWQWR